MRFIHLFTLSLCLAFCLAVLPSPLPVQAQEVTAGPISSRSATEGTRIDALKALISALNTKLDTFKAAANTSLTSHGTAIAQSKRCAAYGKVWDGASCVTPAMPAFTSTGTYAVQDNGDAGVNIGTHALCVLSSTGVSTCGRCSVSRQSNNTWTLSGAACGGGTAWCTAQCY